MNKQLLIGTVALQKLGSSIMSNEIEYLVNDQSNNLPFTYDKENKKKYCNANGNHFFADIWQMEENNIGEIASPQALLEIEAYTFVQHCINHFFKKADEAEFQIKFLVRSFNLDGVKMAGKYVSSLQLQEINEIIRTVIDQNKKI